MEANKRARVPKGSSSSPLISKRVLIYDELLIELPPIKTFTAIWTALESREDFYYFKGIVKYGKLSITDA